MKKESIPKQKKKDIPKGLWYQTPTGKIIETKELADNKYVSPEDDYHVHIGSKGILKFYLTTMNSGI